jgi:hypothetical protein
MTRMRVHLFGIYNTTFIAILRRDGRQKYDLGTNFPFPASLEVIKEFCSHAIPGPPGSFCKNFDPKF